MLNYKKINEYKIKCPRIMGSNPDNKYKELFKEPFFNLFICAKKKSGKTVVIYNILKQVLHKNINIYFFVPTIDKDSMYIRILKLCENKNIQPYIFDSIESFDDEDNKKINNIDAIEKEIETDPDNFDLVENIFIFDDISVELRNKYLTSIMKRNRHFKSIIIISSQYITDLSNSAKLNLDYLLLFGKLSKDNLFNIHRSTSISILFDLFYNIYKEVTSKKFRFLYVDLIKMEFRKRFNKKIILKEEY